MTKHDARQRCIDLIRDIEVIERDGAYGQPIWRKAKDALGKALDDYRTAGATVSDLTTLA